MLQLIKILLIVLFSVKEGKVITFVIIILALKFDGQEKIQGMKDVERLCLLCVKQHAEIN